MELSNNTFSEGLLMDIHPLMLSDKVLTDALNATINTMNGNECILQNDMGNRRVDNAFLPSGYEPVGIKEYGGIIYVASYNPITNKSQIGSFPSPERRIGVNETNPTDINFDYLLSSNNIVTVSNLNNLKCIKLDSVLFPIGNNVYLHAGDKFLIYTTDNNFKTFAENYLSNYYNTTRAKVKTPKNKLYTLSAGVLNSLNEFVDITKTLVRFKENTDTGNDEIVKYTNESDLYKFNDGYFISETLFNPDYGETYNDALLIEERKTLPVNTYAYKLVGPLLLKLLLNHILNFDYNIYGIKSSYKYEVPIYNAAIDLTVIDIREVEGYKVWIEGFITYNCPDGGTSGNDRGDGDYETYEEYEILNFSAFNLIKNNNLAIAPLTTIGGIPEYDKKTNTYKCKITKEYFLQPTNTNYILDKDGDYIKINNNYVEISLLTKYNCTLEYTSNENGNYVYINEKYINLDECTRYSLIDYLFIEDPNGDFIEVDNHYAIISRLPHYILEEIYEENSHGKYVEILNEYKLLSEVLKYRLTASDTYILGVIAGVDNTLLNNNSSSQLTPIERVHYSDLFDPINLYDTTNYIYLSDLSTKVTIDFALFGSNTVKLKEWRFKNNLNQRITELTYSFDAYPKYGESFSDLHFIFTNVNNSENIVEIPALLNNGRVTMIINWDDVGLLQRKLYKVDFTYKSSNNDEIERKQFVNWFLTTELFNDWYSKVADYGNPPAGYDDNKNQIKVKFELKIKNEKSNINVELTGSPVLGSNNNQGTIVFNSTKTVEFDIEHKVKYNQNLYPDYITFYQEMLNSEVTITDGKKDDDDEEFNNPKHFTVDFLYTDSISGTYDNSQGTVDKVIITNGFIDINNIWTNFVDKTIVKELLYAMVAPDFKEITGHRDYHWIYWYTSDFVDSAKTHGNATEDTNEYVKRRQIDYDYGDHPIGYRFSRNKSKIYERFNQLPNSLLFTWGFDGKNQYDSQQVQPTNPGGTYWPRMVKSLNIGDSANWETGWESSVGSFGLLLDDWARVWWRTTYGEWALFDEEVKYDQTKLPHMSLEENIFDKYFKGVIYSYYKQIDLSDLIGEGKLLLSMGILSSINSNPSETKSHILSWKQCLNNNPSGINIDNPQITEEYLCLYIPTFIFNKTTSDIRDYDLITSCSEEYLDLYNTLTNSTTIELKNVYIENNSGNALTIFTDVNGKTLNISEFYKYENDKLVPLKTEKLFVSDEYAPLTGTRGILYNSNITSLPSHLYDWTTGSDSDCTTYEMYDEVVLVEKDYEINNNEE